MNTVDIDQAGAEFSKLIVRLEAGEEIVIARGAIPIAKLVAVAPKNRAVFGAMSGMFEVPPDFFFFDPLPEDELRAWEIEPEDPAG